MRLARYRSPSGIRIGCVENEDVYDLAELVRPAPGGVVDVLAGGRQLRESTSAALADASPSASLADVELLAPLPRPPKFLAVGNNSPSHLNEVETDSPSAELRVALSSSNLVRQAYPSGRFPTIFNKQTNSVSGPFDPIWMPHDAPTLDFEGELAFVVGRVARRLDEAEAEEAIAGYLVTNDVSVREWQIESPLMWQGKSFQTHGPIGPWVTTSDDVDISDLRIRTWVNDELRQDGTTAEWIHSPAAVLSGLSQVCTLEPGDIVAMGTPAGVGIVDGRYLRDGDRVAVEIEGLGRIENQVVPEPRERHALGAAAEMKECPAS